MKLHRVINGIDISQLDLQISQFEQQNLQLDALLKKVQLENDHLNKEYQIRKVKKC